MHWQCPFTWKVLTFIAVHNNGEESDGSWKKTRFIFDTSDDEALEICSKLLQNWMCMEESIDACGIKQDCLLPVQILSLTIHQSSKKMYFLKLSASC